MCLVLPLADIFGLQRCVPPPPCDITNHTPNASLSFSFLLSSSNSVSSDIYFFTPTKKSITHQLPHTHTYTHTCTHVHTRPHNNTYLPNTHPHHIIHTAPQLRSTETDIPTSPWTATMIISLHPSLNLFLVRLSDPLKVINPIVSTCFSLELPPRSEYYSTCFPSS